MLRRRDSGGAGTRGPQSQVEKSATEPLGSSKALKVFNNYFVLT